MNFNDLQTHFGDQFRENESLARYTVARLGGNAAGVVRVKNTDDLIWAVNWTQKNGVDWRILGGGANVLISDKGFNGLVIVNQANGVRIDAETGIVEAESGANLTTVARRCMSEGLKGLEWAVSVPGTVGGAVVNNAGAHGGDMAGSLLEAKILTIEEVPSPLVGEGFGVRAWQNADFAYDYRYSKLKAEHGKYVVLSAKMQLEPGHDPKELNATADGFIAHRKKTQPPGASLGSMFKNPPGDYAGRLIEAAGLKGMQIGGVQISPIHGNFFVNVGHGSAADYNALIELAQHTVKEKFDVDLELEVEKIGEWGSQ